MNISLVTAPAAEPIDLVEAKNHLRVDINEDDILIESLVLLARRMSEGINNHRFVTQTWNIFMDGFPGSSTFYLPKSLSPLASVTHIKYTDADDNQSTFSSANYVVDIYSEPARIKLSDDANWPTDTLTELNGVEIQVVVGYGDPDDVPQEFKQAIMLMIGHWYENREQVTVGDVAREIPLGVEALLWLDRNVPV
jgi:uncharacterized phiE125 gp8 family phage protein